jgi:hypothetical protein
LEKDKIISGSIQNITTHNLYAIFQIDKTKKTKSKQTARRKGHICHCSELIFVNDIKADQKIKCILSKT